jgi:hypothetical protein
MHKGAVFAAIMALLTNGAIADPAPGTSPSANPNQADWHGGHRGGGGHGGDSGGGDGGVIVGFPSGPDAPAPYPPGPYPRSRPTGPSGAASDAGTPPPWPVWYYCDQPSGYYPYVRICNHDWQRLPVMPPPPGSGPPIAAGSWERCDDPAGYFPYIAQCRHPWEPVTASSPVPGDDPNGIAMIGQWYYCEDSQNYLPYAGSCPHIWRTLPSVPPPNIQPANRPKAGG